MVQKPRTPGINLISASEWYGYLTSLMETVDVLCPEPTDSPDMVDFMWWCNEDLASFAEKQASSPTMDEVTTQSFLLVVAEKLREDRKGS